MVRFLYCHVLQPEDKGKSSFVVILHHSKSLGCRVVSYHATGKRYPHPSQVWPLPSPQNDSLLYFPPSIEIVVFTARRPLCSAALPSASPSRREIVFMGVSELGIIARKAQRGPNARKFSGTQQHIIRL